MARHTSTPDGTLDYLTNDVQHGRLQHLLPIPGMTETRRLAALACERSSRMDPRVRGLATVALMRWWSNRSSGAVVAQVPRVLRESILRNGVRRDRFPLSYPSGVDALALPWRMAKRIPSLSRTDGSLYLWSLYKFIMPQPSGDLSGLLIMAVAPWPIST